jgi:hypothetical protein
MRHTSAAVAAALAAGPSSLPLRWSCACASCVRSLPALNGGCVMAGR